MIFRRFQRTYYKLVIIMSLATFFLQQNGVKGHELSSKIFISVAAEDVSCSRIALGVFEYLVRDTKYRYKSNWILAKVFRYSHECYVQISWKQSPKVFYEKRCFPVTFAKFVRATLLQNTSERLLLHFCWIQRRIKEFVKDPSFDWILNTPLVLIIIRKFKSLC